MPTSSDISDFITKLDAFVLEEREAGRQQVRRIWSMPLDERVRKGYAIEGLRVTEIEVTSSGNYELTLVADEDHSRFREGDAVKLTDGRPDDPMQLRAEGRVVSSEAGTLVVAAKRHNEE